ncbi:TPA: helix-turn-helix domain-containing protein [Listeria innocua]|uniref:helix-turn-helix domain-containing protein n=1 Tax=Listeria TaxID=1637 RepID=UPI00083DE993|nr:MULTISPECIES: helix-turn-helix domain-containing protein [Listeria]EAE3728429.1 DNA-binding protein [Listeria monocytogenes serotype 1/2b]EAC3748347.1 DNA-binding protein [Listeria monocytogenes]EAC5124694.1 DNA-binding protein [Listeria monocytogenes]EAC5365842.1 DNA-binding protein [Listeria monocytogenes]EAC5601076.1 DNA-binding protein [Listeria monocytogenes]
MNIKEILALNTTMEEKEKQIDAFYQSELITKAEVRQILDVSLVSLDRYMKQGKLTPFINKSRNILFKKSEVLQFQPEVKAMKELFNK